MLVLVALSVCHLLNDTIQSLLPALYPLLEANYALSFTQIGLMHLVFQCTASLLQPAGRPRSPTGGRCSGCRRSAWARASAAS